jgi:hypothetical protein
LLGLWPMLCEHYVFFVWAWAARVYCFRGVFVIVGYLFYAQFLFFKKCHDNLHADG